MRSFSKTLFCGGLALFFASADLWPLKIEDADFSTILTPNASIINPIFGLAVYLHGQQLLLNLYQYGNPDHPLIKIIQTFFHHDIENEFIRPSGSEANVAYGFGPYEVGWLLALIMCHPNLFDNPDLYLANRGKKDKNSNINKKELDLFIKALDKAHKSRVALENPSRKKKDLRGTSAKKLFDFAANAIKALKLETGEFCDVKFMPLLFNIFACAKAKGKSDLFDFVVRGFIQHATKKLDSKKIENEEKIPSEEYLSTYGKKVAVNKNLQNQFIQEKTNFKEIEKMVAPYYTTLMVDTSVPTKLLFAGTAHLLHLIRIPPKISQLHIIKYDNSPDCAEAAILHIVQCILFDNFNGIFTTKNLPKNLQKNKNVKKILEIFKQEDFNNLLCRTEWFKLLSGRENIVYKKGNFSLNARASNIFEMLNQLFSVKTPTWEKLGNALSSDNVTISFIGPNLHNSKDQTTITFTKKYADNSLYRTILDVDYDNHVAIVESKFEREHSEEQENHLIFTNKLMSIGLPPAVYCAIIPLSNRDFQLKTIPHKKNNSIPFFLTLTQDMTIKGFFELMRLVEKNSKIKQLLDVDSINYDSDTTISSISADWILKTKGYENQFFWNIIANNTELFIERAFFQKNYAAINFFLDKLLAVTQLKSLFHERTFLATVWNEIIAQHKNIENNIEIVNSPKIAASKSYRFNQKALEKIREKLSLKDKTSEATTAKKKIAGDIQHNSSLTKKLIAYDIYKTTKSQLFTYLYPHMLYILLETAILDTNETNCGNCLKLILNNPAYLNTPIYHDLTIRTLPIAYGDGYGIAKKPIEVKRAIAIKKLLTNNLQQQKIL